MKIRFLEPLIQIQPEGGVWPTSVTPVPDSKHDNKQNGDRDKKKNNRSSE